MTDVRKGKAFDRGPNQMNEVEKNEWNNDKEKSYVSMSVHIGHNTLSLFTKLLDDIKRSSMRTPRNLVGFTFSIFSLFILI